MSNIGFVTFSSPGHLNPSITLATELFGRGHQVTFYTPADGTEMIEASGFRSRPYGLQEFGPQKMAEDLERLGQLAGLRAVRFTIDMSKRQTSAALRELPVLMQEDQIDGLVVDQVISAGGVTARAEGIPFVTVSNALPINLDTISPPVFTSRGPARGPLDRLAVRLLNRLQSHLTKPILDALNEHQQSRRLPKIQSISQVTSDLAQITQLPAQFDFPRQDRADTFHHTGPFHKREWRATVDFPWERVSDSMPLIYASMGTLQNRMRHVFEMIAEACEELPVQLIISLGNGADVEQFAGLPGNPITVRYAPQLDLLRKSAVCITHAGFNTALECLAHGVPMLAIPVTNDQPGVAARIQYHELGIVCRLRKLTPEKIRSGLQTLLQEPHYTENVKSLQTAIAPVDALATAAQIIEQALSTGLPVRRLDS